MKMFEFFLQKIDWKIDWKIENLTPLGSKYSPKFFWVKSHSIYFGFIFIMHSIERV